MNKQYQGSKKKARRKAYLKRKSKKEDWKDKLKKLDTASTIEEMAEVMVVTLGKKRDEL